MKAAQRSGSDVKQEIAKVKEGKRLDTLDFLKTKGGPFTDEREIEEYLAKQGETEKEKVKSMKLGLQYARDTSTLLPKTDPIFKIEITVLEKGKRRQKTPEEFGAALKSLLGKRGRREIMEYSTFQNTLKKMVKEHEEHRT